LVFPAEACTVALWTALAALLVLERDRLASVLRKQFRRFGTPRLEFAGGGKTQGLYLLRFQLAEVAGFDIEDQRSVADATDLLNVVPDLLEHLAQFAIAAFNEDNFVPGIVSFANLADAGRGSLDIIAFFRVAALDRDAFAEAVERLFGRLAGNFDEVGFFDAGSGLGELIGEVAIVGNHEQAFAEVVEAADGVKALGCLREELHYGGTAFRIGDGGDEAPGLVEHEVTLALGSLQQLSIDADVVAGSVCFGAERRDDLAVDLDPAAGDHLFGVAAARDTGLGKNLLQALELRSRHLAHRGFPFGLRVIFLLRSGGFIARDFKVLSLKDFRCAGGFRV